MRCLSLLCALLMGVLAFGCQLMDQDTDVLKVELAVAEGDSPFGHYSSIVNPEDSSSTGFSARMRQPVTGLPDSLLDIRIFSEHMHYEQLRYQAYKTGVIDSTEFFDWAGADFDTSGFTPEFVDQEVYFAVGWTSDSVQVLLFDTNNNEDFSDEEVYQLPARDPDQSAREIFRSMPRVPVNVEMYNGVNIEEVPVPIVVNPAVPPSMASTGAVWFGSELHNRGTLSYKGQEYAWWATNLVYAGIFEDDYTRIWVEPYQKKETAFPEHAEAQVKRRQEQLQETSEAVPDGHYPPIPEPYKMGEVISLGEDSFRLTSIDRAGSLLVLDRVETENIGLRIGMIAPGFNAQTLEGKTLHLSDYYGKHVLIDFWGTWCSPCIEEIPYLQGAYDAYSRDQFDILAVANDNPDSVRVFVEKEQLRWTQIVQRQGNDSLSAVLEAYKITGYPTTFLIDPEGVIVAKEGELRGERLAETLRTYVGE
ncbi:MAG: TlpA family protein disulfide reductase [Rhodothermaceae bacterium]|nr:TlpA family protein disulfide reductase [Rhodothermaceae bacterium]